MLTCRECRFSSEFSHFNSELPPREAQNLYCAKHDTVEPVFNWVTFRGMPQALLRKVEALRCFKSRGR